MNRLFRFAGIDELKPLPQGQLLLDEERNRNPTPRPLGPRQLVARQIGRPNITVLPPIKNPPITIRTTNFNTRVPLPPIPSRNGGRRRSKKSDTTKKSKTKSKSKSRSRISTKRKKQKS